MGSRKQAAGLPQASRLPINPEIDRVRKSISVQEQEIARKAQELEDAKRALAIEQQVTSMQKRENADRKLVAVRSEKEAVGKQVQALAQRLADREKLDSRSGELQDLLQRQKTIVSQLDEEESARRKKDEDALGSELQLLMEQLETKRRELQATQDSLQSAKGETSQLQTRVEEQGKRHSEMQEEMQHLVATLTDEERRQKKIMLDVLTRGVIRLSAHRVQNHTYRMFSIWRIISRKRPAAAIQSEGGEETVVEEEMAAEMETVREMEVAAGAPPESMEVEVDMSSFESFPAILQAEIRSLISENPLYRAFLQSPAATPMPLTDLTAAAEALVDYCIQAYKDCQSRNQRLPTMPQLCLNFFAATGGKSAEFVAGVMEQSKAQNDTGALLSRVLALPGTTPLSYCGALSFPRLCNWLKVVKAKGSKAATNFTLSGKISLAELLTATYDYFAADPASGSRLIALLYTHCNISEDALSIFIVSHRMRFRNLDSLKLFKTIDEDGSGQLNCEEFTTGIKQHLNVWLEDSLLRKLYKTTDADGSDSIKRIEFNTLFNFKRYNENASSEVFAIEVAKALKMIMEVIDAKTESDLSSVESVITGPVTSIDEFTSLLVTLAPELEENLVQPLYTTALGLSQDPSGIITREAAIRCLLRYPPVKSPLGKSYSVESEWLLGSD